MGKRRTAAKVPAPVDEVPELLRVRFHGRGGQGMKTASRVVGTAAFRSGFEVQDAPVYGAERRGAAVTAFTRIGTEPVLERGVIGDPDLIVVADATLLGDPAAGVLGGQEGATAVFVNTNLSARGKEGEGLAEQHGILPELITLDVTGRTLEALGKASALSAGMGAAAARLTGVIALERLLAAVEEELSQAGVAREEIAKNAALAGEIFGALRPVARWKVAARASGAELIPVGYDEPELATPSVLAAGNAVMRHTGTWRLERPVIDYDRCTRCGLCFVRCPDGAIVRDEEGYPVIDYDHCKGCLICRQICPIHGIETRRETEAW